MQLFGTDLLKTYWAHDVKMTSMRRRYVASTSLRSHVPAASLAPLAPPHPIFKTLAPQYSKPSYAYGYNVNLVCTKISRSRISLFFFLLENIRFGYLLESPRRGDSNKYTKHMIYKKIFQSIRY